MLVLTHSSSPVAFEDDFIVLAMANSFDSLQQLHMYDGFSDNTLILGQTSLEQW